MPPRSPIPKPGVTHGLGPTGKPSGYAQGCGCQACRDAKNAYEAPRRAARRAAAPPVRLARDEARTARIGVVLSARVKTLIEREAARDGVPGRQWIRDPALQALTERAGYVDTAPARPAQTRREGISPDGTTTPGMGDAWEITVDIPFTKVEKALIKQVAAEDDVTPSEWVRELALARLEERGHADTGRHKAPRRPRRNNQEQEGQQS